MWFGSAVLGEFWVFLGIPVLWGCYNIDFVVLPLSVILICGFRCGCFVLVLECFGCLVCFRDFGF